MSDLRPPDTTDVFDGEDLTAAEYALGVLDGPERAAAEARSAQEPEFAETVLAWTLRFEPLIDAVPPVEPSSTLWPRIETAIDRPKGQPATLTEPPVPANDAPRRGSMIWRVWAIGASAVAAAAVAFIAVRTPVIPGHPALVPSASSSPALVATLSLTETKASAFTVAYDPVRSMLFATPAGDFSIPYKRSAELWLIPADGKPRPMGLVDPSKPASMPMPPKFKALAKAKATLALSIEPPGGSATGLPTGPVIATGQLAVV